MPVNLRRKVENSKFRRGLYSQSPVVVWTVKMPLRRHIQDPHRWTRSMKGLNTRVRYR